MCLHELIPKTCPNIYSLALPPRRRADEGAGLLMIRERGLQQAERKPAKSWEL